MRVDKAIVTAAGPNQGRLGFQRFFDTDGKEKSALQIIAEEVFSAGIKDLAVIISPGTTAECRAAVGKGHPGNVEFIEQTNPTGYADALLRGEQFTDRSAFLHLVGDHLHLSNVRVKNDDGKETIVRCAKQLVDRARTEACAMSAVQATSERLLQYYGTVGGVRSEGGKLVKIDRVIEKPTPTVAEQELQIPGVRSGKYFCFFGIHVLTPSVFEVLKEFADKNKSLPTLSVALNELAKRERYLAMELKGTRYDLGVPYGTLMTQLALALSGSHRDNVLMQLVELLAQNRQRDEQVSDSA